MTRHRSFKRFVRARMGKTGESYAAARAALLAAREPDAASAPALATSDDAIRERTGRGWEEWFDLLDEAGMGDRPHREIARWVAELLGVVPLAWAAQAVTVSYERARGGRAPGRLRDHRIEDGDGVGPPTLRRICRRSRARSLARRRRAARAHRDEAEVGSLRLGRRPEPGQCHVPSQGRGDVHRGGRARAPGRRRRGRADEGMVARAPHHAEGAPGGR